MKLMLISHIDLKIMYKILISYPHPTLSIKGLLTQ
jgi:hypothetical protein